MRGSTLDPIEERRRQRLRDALDTSSSGSLASPLGTLSVRLRNDTPELERNQRDLGNGARQRVRMPGAE